MLVTGATGSGKTTTLASMLDHVNRTRRSHIVTIEDPLEILHEDRESIVNQREVGLDTESFGQALRRALRQDPDTIMIGELRDAETAQTALQAAESGHLVFSTLHTIDAAETIGRMIEFFPEAKQQVDPLDHGRSPARRDLPAAAPAPGGGRVAGGRGDDRERPNRRPDPRGPPGRDPRRDRGRRVLRDADVPDGPDRGSSRGDDRAARSLPTPRRNRHDFLVALERRAQGSRGRGDRGRGQARPTATTSRSRRRRTTGLRVARTAG